MELVITKEFLDDFFISFDEENKYHVDFKEFLTTKIKGVTIITDLQDVTEWEQASEENPLWLYLLDIPMMTPEFVPTVETDIATPSFYSTYTYPYKLFFTSKDKNTCENLCKDYGFEYLSIENLEDKWKTYYSQRDDFHLPIDSISIPRFDNWAKLSDFKHPINSIIVFDKYLFAEKNTPTNQQWSVDDNLMKVFENLLNNQPNMLPLDLSIIIMKEHIKPVLAVPSGMSKLEYAHKRVKDFFNLNFPRVNVNISIIHYDKQKHTSQKEHGRGVYTNYFYIFIEQGINIFNCSGQIINNSHISYFFPFRSANTNIVMSKLKNFKTYLNDIDSYLIANPSERGNYIYGSGNNRLVQEI
ncbi:MAG: hypothetical protein EAZ06_01110 [Cytophagales bacterium]|nr:MAG: hypothetical protein EAZ06_01110 [Cytophagales bacterium]